MIDLFGGIRFRYINLFNVDGPRILLGAWAETLEYLVFNPIDPWGGRLFLKGVRVLTNSSTVVSSLLDLNLSRHKYLRTLGILASSINRIPTDCSSTRHHFPQAHTPDNRMLWCDARYHGRLYGPRLPCKILALRFASVATSCKGRGSHTASPVIRSITRGT